MSLVGKDVLLRRVRSIKQAIEGGLFEEAARDWVELDFKPVAQSLAPVRSGALRDSIDGTVGPNQIRVFADTDYASFVEEGTSKQPAQPFMKPAFDIARPKLSARTRKALRKKL